MSSPESPSYIVADVNFVAPHFPQYEFIELLGQGAMGASYRAVQKKLDREIVFKVIARRIGRNEAFFDAFTTQAKMTAKLNHTNAVKVFDFGAADEMLFLIQEYVSGMPLDVAIRGSKVEVEQSLELLLGISSGLMYAHSKGVVHGNLQTSTVFLSDAAVPKINDFGLAMALRANGSGSASTMNPNYTAPEVLNGEIFGDELADVYSLGGILYRLITGYRLSDQAGLASSLSDCGTDGDAIIARALAADRSQRYQSVEEFHSDLVALQHGLAREVPVVAVAAPQAPLVTAGAMSGQRKLLFPQ